MKKIIAIFGLFLAFSINSNAQEAKKNLNKEEITQKNITQDISDLTKTVKMDESLTRDFTTLLNMRAEAMNGSQSEEDRKAIFERFSKKMIGGLTPEQLEQLKSNNALYTRLTQYKK